ncbi:hypothetical protein OPT61_g9131 [Boeremia exigua]|uniref:Uncharacterized protein n=1 Tax=Boeremia exigua TaxID=749465 RepID=A0ACC2HVS6_9PLEO|nr:hypothetical protein OPT61_g9131 [Boeremia exigua]
MSTRRTRRTAATTEVTEEVVTVETRSKRTRAAPRKAAVAKTSKTTKDTSSSRIAQPATRSEPVASTPAHASAPAPAATPAPATNKRRLRSTTEAASPLRALDEQPAKKQRTSSRKVSTPAPASAKPAPIEEDDDEEETPIFFTKSEPLLFYPSHESTLIETPLSGFDHIAFPLQLSSLKDKNAELEAICSVLREERDDAIAELSRLRARLADLEEESRQSTTLKTSPVKANSPTPEFDSFDVEEPESPKTAFMTGDESAMALLRHVQEASRAPVPTSPTSVGSPTSPTPHKSPAANTQAASPVTSPTPVSYERPSTPSRGIFGSFTSSFTALRSLFGSSTAAPPSPTPSRQPPADTITEVLTMPPTPVGERPKRPTKKPKRHNRIVKALLKGIDQQEMDKATAWAKQIAAEFQKDSTAGDKRKRLETPVLFRDLKHFPSSKPWESGFSFPEDVLDLEDDDVVPGWAVYTSMVEEEQYETKKTKTAHVSSADDDMPASLNELFSTSTASVLDLKPRRSIDPSPMFETPLRHQQGTNIFTELRGHDAAVNDRENLQRELKTKGVQFQNQVQEPSPNVDSLQRVHDPVHGSFSVPESDSEEEDEPRAKPVWTQAPPPAPTPAHVSLPNATHNEEIERQRQKLMKHTPHKPSRLQQVSYPSPSLMSDAGESPFKNADIFGDIPDVEPLHFDDPELDAAFAAASAAGALEATLATMNWSMPVVTYDSDEEDLSPI